jgi:molybdopterin/thiamine biosynthesis adenylyltransferase
LKTDLKVAVIGAGGNGSWLLKHLHRLIKKHQIPESIHFTVFDGDDVEQKNTLYQDFETKDVLDNKAKVMAHRYDFSARPKYLELEKDLEEFNVIICCVDNRDFRELLFRHVDKHPEKYWIDVRAEGQGIVIFTKNKKNTLEEMLKTLPKEGTKSTSCQRDFELSNGIVQMGNQIAAVIVAQYFLNFIREEENPPMFNHMF